jgi:hypothetical protein
MIYTCAKCGGVADDDIDVGTETPEGFICEGCAAEAEEMKDKFNKYCADVMGLEVRHTDEDGELWVWFDGQQTFSHAYNPYDDLNKMAEVVEKLAGDGNIGHAFIDMLFNDKYEINNIKQAFRDFILSTMEEEK